MSDFDLPDLPSDEELGLTPEDLAELEKEVPDDGPEMSEAEMLALLGGPVEKKVSPTASPADQKKAAKAAKAAAKKAEKAKKAAAKQAEKDAKAAKRKAAAEQKAAAAGGKGAAGIAGAAGAAAATAKAAGGAGAGAGGSTGADADAEAPATAARPPRPRPTEGPRSKWRGPATLAALAVILVSASLRTGLPRPVPANAPDTDFSSARAMASLVEIARRAHPPGSPEHARVRGLLMDHLMDLGLEPEIQTTTTMLRRSPQVASGGTVRNIVARVPGTASTGAVLITAHYDGRELSPGAGDDGSGVVTILESLRALRASGPLQNDLIVLLTDGEELGLLGARAFVDEHPWMPDVKLALSFEMRGSGGPSIMFETGSENGWVLEAYKTNAPNPMANSLIDTIYQSMPNDTDFSPFREVGVQGLNFAAADRAHVYHQTFDTPENLSEATLQHHGLNALAALRQFGNADLSGTLDEPNVVYFSMPFVGLVVYDTKWVLPISGGVLLLLFAGFFAVGRAGATTAGIVVGAGIMLLGTALVYGAAMMLAPMIGALHAEAGSLHGSAYHSEGWYMLAAMTMALAIVSVLHHTARRWFGAAELAYGASIAPALAAIAVGVFMPLGAMNLQIPAIATLTAIVVVALLGNRGTGWAGWAVGMVAAAVGLQLLVFLAEVAWILGTFALIAPIAALMAAAAYLCLPALDHLRHPNSFWAPSTFALLTAAFFGMGWLAAKPSADRPAPTTLAYAYDHSTAEALWITEPVRDSLDLPARAWAEAAIGSTFASDRSLEEFAYGRSEVPVALGPRVAASPPLVLVENDTTMAGVRRVVLSVRSEIGAERMIFRPDGSRGTQIVSVNGVEMDDPTDLEVVDHWGDPEPVVILVLEMPAAATIGLTIVEHLLRPQELLGPEAFQRPPEFMPNINRASDRAMFKYTIDETVLERGAGLGALLGNQAADTSIGTDTLTTGASATIDAPPSADTTMTTDTLAADTLMTTDTVPTADTLNGPGR